MKVVIVGDLHAHMNNLEDTQKIFQKIKDIAVDFKIKDIIFTGDIYHTHAVLRQEVVYIVQGGMKTLTGDGISVTVIAGNHDGASPHSVSINALRQTLDGIKGISIVDETNMPLVSGDFTFVPFIKDEERFVEIANQNPDKILVCHQTFDGAQYENGFYAPDGFDADKLKHDTVIGGHIHKHSELGKIFYVGSPRALTSSEANESKYLWIYDTATKEKKAIATDDFVKVFKTLDFHEGVNIIQHTEFPIIKTGDDVRVYIHGSQEYFDECLVHLKNTDLFSKIKIVHIKEMKNKNQINIDSATETLESGLRKYVFEVSGMPEEKANKVWKKLQGMIPNL